MVYMWGVRKCEVKNDSKSWWIVRDGLPLTELEKTIGGADLGKI